MKLDKNQSGFTLLEIIIVIIIIGVLASLALPRFVKTVEFSRSTEALTALGTIRRSMDICYQPTQNYQPCLGFAQLSILDPGAGVGAHWGYTWPAPGVGTYLITARRNSTVDGGVTTDTITIDQDGTKTGTNNFAGIR